MEKRNTELVPENKQENIQFQDSVFFFAVYGCFYNQVNYQIVKTEKTISLHKETMV